MTDDVKLAPARPESSPKLDLGPLADRLGYALRRAQIAVFRDFFVAFAPFDIKPAQYSILTVIERNPGLKQSQVSEALGIKRTNFVAMIDELEARRLVRRAESLSDRRSHALVLTAEGEALMPKLHETSATHEARMRDALGAPQHREMIAALAGLAAELQGGAEEE